MNKKITRKKFLKNASLVTIGFSGFGNYLLSSSLNSLVNFSPSLRPDKNKILDQPKGFK